MQNSKENPLSFESLCVQGVKENRSTPPHQLPLYATSSFSFEQVEDSIDVFTGKKQGHVYSRYANPTTDSVANKIAQLESFGTSKEAYAFLTSSGMSAISSIGMALLKDGDSILTQGNLYGGTTELFQKLFSQWNIRTFFADFTDLDEVERLITENPSINMIYLESPANPTLSCVDLKSLTSLARSYDILTVIDNTFPTPYLQRPFLYDVDFIIHSSTKYLNGHGTSISGVIVGWKEEYRKRIWEVIKLAGTHCSPWEAWLLNNGLKTLPLRMDKHCENAMALATFLSENKKVEIVNYVGLKDHPHHLLASRQMTGYGGMLSFAVDGNKDQAIRFINGLKMITMAPTLGDVDTLVLHPATSSHLNISKDLREKYGITDNLVRLSVGIERIEDIINDVDKSLNAL